jgi:alpha-L-fucosidase 2
MWREALPAGNGTIGAAVYGAVHDETVLLTHEALRHGVKTPELPDVSGELSRVRKLLFDGKAGEADRVIADALAAAGYAPEIGTPLPLGDLKIKMPVCQGFKNYRRVLDMETGEITVSWDDDGFAYERRLFVSRPDDLVVMEIRADGGSLEADITLGLHDPVDAKRGFSGESPLPENAETRREGDWIFYAARNDDGTDFGAVARIAKKQTAALAVVKLFISEERSNAWKRLQDELAETEMNYKALLVPHAAEHGGLFGRVSLDLGAAQEERALSNEELLLQAYQGEAPAALIEKMWAYGRYLLICSSREGGLPCPLLGKWCGEYKGFWAFNMANENLQMIYWQALSGGLPETLRPVFDYFDGKLDDFRENARKLFGCRGICIPAVTTPASGLHKVICPHVLHWTGAAAWIGQHYYDYYLYTGDEQFLKERALPFLRETALFYEDFFTVGEDGFFVSAPSNSPENNPAEYWDGLGMGQSMETTINATMDFALAKEVLTHLIEGSAILGEDGTEVEKWKGMLATIPPYQINEDGAVREWMHPFFSDNYHHRHQSHIYPVFPGIEVTRESDPELFGAFEVAIRKRLKIGIGEQTGWSLAHMACVYARMENGCSALECLNLLSRSCIKNNFYTTHNDWRGMGIGVEMEWAPFQIDANMGWSAAIQEMLLFSVPGKLKVLPALPKKWASGSVKGLVARGGITVSIGWNENEIAVELLSATDQIIGFSVDGGEWKQVGLTAGEMKREVMQLCLLKGNVAPQPRKEAV